MRITSAATSTRRCTPWTLWPRWGGTVSRRPCHCLPERMSLVTLLMLLWNWLPKLLVARITWNSILENFGWWWQWAARWAVCHKRTAPEELKIYLLQLQFRAVQEPQSIFQPECKYSWSWQDNRVVKEQKMACPSNTPFEGWYCSPRAWGMSGALVILNTFKKRNPPNLCGFYYRMTDLVASQLYNLSDIVKANSAIRHLHRHSEAARGWSWQCIAMSRGSRHPKPRPNLRKKYSDQILSFWMWSAVKVS